VTQPTALSAPTRWALAIGCAISVGNLYYLQPLLSQVARHFHVTEGQAGFAATLGQIGYALGMLTIVPLGDIRERRSLVLTSLLATSVVALAMAVAPSFEAFCIASLTLGFTTCTPQLLVPFAAVLSKPEERGRTVGFVMSGLLLGILLARTVSGFVASHFGWQAVYIVAAVLSVIVALGMRLLLPENRADNAHLSYPKLLHSLGELVKTEPILRESAVYGACLFGSFSAFWTTLAFFLQRLLQVSPEKAGEMAGLFGLIGAAGALAAPIAGRLADRDGPRRTILVGILSVAVSFGIMLVGSIGALVGGVLLMDVGVQAAHISNQSRIFARRPEARNRMNTVYMTTYFAGGSLGSALGTWGWANYAWPGVCATGALFAVVATAVFRLTKKG